MKILYVAGALLSSNTGDTEHVLNVSRQMAAQGDAVHLVAVSKAQTPPYTEGNSGLHVHPVARDRAGSIRTLLSVARQARIQARRLAPDIVYVRPFPLDWILLLRYLKRLGVPYVCELNTMVAGEYRSKGQTLKGALYEWFYAKSIRHARGILPVTAEIGRWAEEVSGVSKPMLIAGNGVDLDKSRVPDSETREAVRRKLDVAPGVTVLAMAGFASPWHGYDRAIAMMAHLDQEVQLWLIGSESRELDTKVLSVARSFGVQERVKVFPRMDQDAVSEMLGATDAGVGPLGLDRNGMAEAQPIKVRFYLSCGVPVLYNYLDPRLDPGLPFLSYVASVKPEELAAGVKKLRDLLREDREAARAFAVGRLSWAVIAAETRQFLAELLQKAVQ